MNRPALAALLLASALGAPARAQLITSTLGDAKYASLSRADCTLDPQETTNFHFSWSYTFVNGQEEEVFLSRSSSCGNSYAGTPPEALLLRTRAARSGDSGRFPEIGSTEGLTSRKLFDFAAADCGGEAGVTQTVYLCVSVYPPSGALTTTPATKAIAVKLDSAPPATPVNVTVEPLDSGLVVDWSMPSDLLGASRYAVKVRGSDGTDHGTTVDGASSRSATISGLTNDEPYVVTVTAFDDAGTARARHNESPASAPVTGTPQAVQDFFERYRAAGGAETGGCASTGGGLLAAGAALALALLRRRPGAAAALLVATAADARASAVEPDPLPHSPRHFTLSVRGGRFAPNVDAEAALKGATPYADIFGASSPWLLRLQLDVDVFDALGRASVGLSGGLWSAEGKGRLASNPTAKSEQEVSLALRPVTPVLTYRAEFVWERWKVPLVPFLRAGFGFAQWTSRKGDATSASGADAGTGWARGLEFGGGLELVLDAFEPAMAARIDQDNGINSTRAFVAFDAYRWKGAHGLLLQGNSLSGGLAIAF